MKKKLLSVLTVAAALATVISCSNSLTGEADENVFAEWATRADGDTIATFQDYLGRYMFVADFRYIGIRVDTMTSDTTNVDTTRTVSYLDTMYDASDYDGDIGEMLFINAINEYALTGNETYINFKYEESGDNIGKISYLDYAYNYQETENYLMVFVPCVLNSDATAIGFIWDMELELDLSTGRLDFPTTFTHDELGTLKAYYVVWAWAPEEDEDGNVTYVSAGRWSENFMTDVISIKVIPTPKQAAAFPAIGNGTVKIPVRITPPNGFDSNSVVKANQVAFRK